MKRGPKKFISVAHLAERWDVPRSTLDEWVNDGLIPASEIPFGKRRRVRIDMEYVAAEEKRWEEEAEEKRKRLEQIAS